MLSGDRGAADDEEIHPGPLDHIRELLGAGRRQGPSDGDSGSTDLSEPGLDQLRLDGLGVQLLHAPRRGHLVRRLGQLLIGRRRILVPGPQPLQVEHSQAAQTPHLDGGRGRHHRVHRGSHYRRVEGHRIDAPAQIHLRFGPGTPGGCDGDVVEGVSVGGVLGMAEFIHWFSCQRDQ